MEIFAVIPARGGSTRIPRKNLRLLSGKPLLVYTIEQAKASKLITRFVVTSDDEEILEVARQYGADVIKRPLMLSRGEDGSMVRTIRHTLEYTEKWWDYKPYIVVILQPTSPLRTPDDIDRTIQLVLDTGADSAETQCAGKENGAVYASKRYVFMEQNKILGSVYQVYEMPEERSVDIDTEDDFVLAEKLLKGGASVDSGVLHKLVRPKRSKGDDKKHKRGRPKRTS